MRREEDAGSVVRDGLGVPDMNRRSFLAAAGIVGLGAAGASLLDACGGGATGGTSGGNATLPAFVPAQVVKPDFPAINNGTPPGYLAYPANPPQMFKEPPAKGGTINAFINETGTPPGLAQNQYWQELNKRIGAQINFVSWAGDYADKLATIVAGGDLPDIMQMDPASTPNLAQLLATDFQDLSEWLAGDAIKAYPNLANLPTQAWKNVVFNGGIYGIPWPLGVVGSDQKVRQDIVDQLGLSTDIKNGQDFLKLCKELTSPSAQRWAIDIIGTAQVIVSQAVGVPNQWKEQGGKFTSQYETAEFKQVLSILNQMWKAGYIYPGAVVNPNDQNQIQWFESGKAVIQSGGYTNWASFTSAGTALNPKFKMGGLITPKWDGGGQAAHYQGSGMYTLSAVKKASKSRVKELLEVYNWCAAPFGTEEYLFLHYGIPGRDYTLQGTDPVASQTGVTERGLQATYIVSGPLPVWVPGFKDVTKTDYTFLKQMMTKSLPLPTVGLTSNTATTKGATIEKNITSLITDIVVGRQPLSAWSDGVQAWRTGGGDQIRKEYQQSLQKSGKKSASA